MDNVKKISVKYFGEFCQINIGNKEYLSIDEAEFEIDESGTKKIEITVCSTLANALKDRFSAYDGIECAEVKELTLYKMETK